MGGRDNYSTERHRMVVYEHQPSQARSIRPAVDKELYRSPCGVMGNFHPLWESSSISLKEHRRDSPQIHGIHKSHLPPKARNQTEIPQR
ncbi:hypothetical protein J6590_040204 [Homalodisca vitripennis]|nr:hypothetical protein J6590_040204 [Homalodisca vitripennis]